MPWPFLKVLNFRLHSCSVFGHGNMQCHDIAAGNTSLVGQKLCTMTVRPQATVTPRHSRNRQLVRLAQMIWSAGDRCIRCGIYLLVAASTSDVCAVGHAQHRCQS